MNVERKIVLVVLSTFLFCCAGKTPKPVTPTRKPSVPTKKSDIRPIQLEAKTHQKEIEAYLEKVSKVLSMRWNDGVRKHMTMWLAEDHPVNNPLLATEIEIILDLKGQPKYSRLIQSSGVRLFDNAALRIARTKQKFPTPPKSLSEYHLSLRWVFFRNQRGCDRRYAHIIKKPFTSRFSLEMAIYRGKWARARDIVAREGASEGVREALTRSALKVNEPSFEDMLMDVAMDWQLAGLLREDKTSDNRWNAALDALIRRKAGDDLKEIVKDFTGESFLPVTHRIRTQRTKRLLAILQALIRLGYVAPKNSLSKALKSDNPNLARAAAALVRDRRLLKDSFARCKEERIKIVMAARILQLGNEPAAITYLRKYLRGSPKAKEKALAALAISAAPILSKDLGKIILDPHNSRALRVRAISILSSWKKGLGILFRAMRSKDHVIKLAAINALEKMPGKSASSYRLSEIAYKDKDFASAAIKVLVKIAPPRFHKDVMWLTSRLNAADQAKIAINLPKYGDAAIGRLKKMLASKDPALKVAALRALKRMDSPKARALVENAGDLPKEEELVQDDGDETKKIDLSVQARHIEPLLRRVHRQLKK